MIEVATFRRDAAYSDGRHPDAVEFTNAEEDARRRDFTINALFYDPIEHRVIDYVDGQQDISAKVIRAVGDADKRIDEDKLRMLRAVRFAAVFDFEIEAQTFAAVKRHAAEIDVVSAERIAEELRRMLIDANRARSVELLRESGLLTIVIPELAETMNWHGTDSLLELLESPSFSLAFAALVSSLGDGQQVRKIAKRLKLSNDETGRAVWLSEMQGTCAKADSLPWHALQRILIHPGAAELVALDAAHATVHCGDLSGVELSRMKLALPFAVLNPEPLLTGEDLIHHGVPRGKIYRTLLEEVRDAQLDGDIQSREDAFARVDQIIADAGGS